MNEPKTLSAELGADSVQRMVSLQPGTRYTKDGISVDIDDVKDGEVYVRRWPNGVTTQPFFANCIRMPVAQFVEQVQGATMEDNNQYTTPVVYQTPMSDNPNIGAFPTVILSMILFVIVLIVLAIRGCKTEELSPTPAFLQTRPTARTLLVAGSGDSISLKRARCLRSTIAKPRLQLGYPDNLRPGFVAAVVHITPTSLEKPNERTAVNIHSAAGLAQGEI